MLLVSIRSAGSVGDFMIQVSYKFNEWNLYYFWLFYDFIIYVVFKIFFVNVLFSFIINKFKLISETNNKKK